MQEIHKMKWVKKTDLIYAAKNPSALWHHKKNIQYTIGNKMNDRIQKDEALD